LVVPPDPDLAASAEEVRAFLVEVRGGAPFLSSTDGKALHAWLTAGIPVTTVLRGIEATAARRKAKRTRTPFTLVSCRKAIESAAQGAPVAVPAPATESVDFPGEAELVAETTRLLADVQLPDPEARARARCAIAREFHRRLWDGLGDARAALLAEAAAALDDLAGTLEDRVFDSLCEEWAREELRRRYPRFSPTRIWEECALGVE
jgi:hypothetical protein